MLLKTIKEDDNICQLAMNGRLDMAGVSEIEIDFAEKTNSADRSVVVDMTEVPFLASLGMRMFLSVAKRLKQNQKKLILLNTNTMVRDALKIAGFERLIALADNESDVDALLND